MSVTQILSLFTSAPDFVRQVMVWQIMDAAIKLCSMIGVGVLIGCLVPPILQQMADLTDTETKSLRYVCWGVAAFMVIGAISLHLPAILQVYLTPDVALLSIIRGY